MNDYKAERDTLIEDIAILKANISRLEQENRFLLSRKENLFDIWRDENKRSVALSKKLEQLERENRNLKNENKAILSQSNTYFDEWQEAEKQRSEFNLYVNLYITLTNHIRMKAECNPGIWRYIDLVNYIDRLESIDDER